MKKILIINTFGIGDCLFSTPLVRAIKNRYSDTKITYICNKRSYDIIRNNPHVSKVYIFEKDDYRAIWAESRLKLLKEIISFVRMIRKERYDIAFDMSLGYIYSLFLFMAEIPVRIGFNYRNRGKFLTHKVAIEGFNDKHVIEYYLDLGAVVGADTSDKEMELVISDKDRDWARAFLAENGIQDSDKICGIIPGCGVSWGRNARYRRWSFWKFAEAADHVVNRYGYKAFIFGERSERDVCLKTQYAMKAPSIQLCGITDLKQFASLLDRCDIVITNDGGPLHMAVALKKKTVSIFGPVDEANYGPYPHTDRNIVLSSEQECRPCYKSFKHRECESLPCLTSLKPDKAISAIDELLKING